MTRHCPISFGLTGHGSAVLLLHGLGGDRQQSLTLLPPDFPATRLTPELPGHGTTDLDNGEPLDFTSFAALTADLVDTLHRDARLPSRPLPVAGVSMGAGVAVDLATARPDLVEDLILIRPAWLDASPPPNLAPFATIADLLVTRVAPDAAAAFRRSPAYDRVRRESPAMAASLLAQFSRPLAVERARVLADMPAGLPLPTLDAYHLFAVDTLVVAAPADPVHPEELARRLAEAVPDARLALVPPKRLDPTEHQRALQAVVAAELTRVRTPRG